MADYNKQTVAQLRQLLKDRGIPSTGLTRKAQIVEKLEEADSADAGAPEASDAPADAAIDAQEPEGAEAQSAQEDPVVPGPPLEEAGGMSIDAVEHTCVLMVPQNQSQQPPKPARKPGPEPRPTLARRHGPEPRRRPDGSIDA